MSDIFVRNDLILPASVDWYDFWRKPEVAALAVATRGRAGAGRE
jgi:hypothetical protein